MFGKKDAPAEPAPTRRFADNAGEFDTVVGDEMYLKGELKGEANVAVGGSMEGSADLQGLLIVHVKGKLKGNITAKNVIIEGQVEGDIKATNKVELRSSCRVSGNIEASSVAMAEGCFYQGNINMQGETDTKPIDSFYEKRLPLQPVAAPTDVQQG